MTYITFRRCLALCVFNVCLIGYWFMGQIPFGLVQRIIQPHFHDRIKEYNHNISRMRLQVLTERHNRTWSLEQLTKYKVVLEHKDGFLQEMATFKFVKAVVLPWQSDTSNTLASNTLQSEYYQWVGAKPLCEWMRKGTIQPFIYSLMYNYTCHTQMSLSKHPQLLEPIHFHWKPVNKHRYWPTVSGHHPKGHYTRFPDFVFYIHILQDAIVTPTGDVFTNTIKVAPNTCSTEFSPSIKGAFRTSPLHKEVFVLTHRWGGGFFHSMIETLPRLAPYIQFLKDNPDVKIVVPNRLKTITTICKLLLIDVHRFVFAPLRAEIVYLPQGTPCGSALIQQTQLLSQIYRNFTEEYLDPGPRNKLVLIQRSGSRHLLNHSGLVEILKPIALDYDLEFAHWTDRPVPSMKEGMKMFYEAVLVVAPHGAGEANLIFSQPGTYLIELLCNRPHVNLCYQREAIVLGHHYYGIPSKRGCERFIDVNIGLIREAVLQFLKLWQHTNN